jgi:O-antigen ligase
VGVGGVLLAATGWNMLMHPAPPIDTAGPSEVLISFGLWFVFLIQFVHFVKTPGRLVAAVAVLILVIIANTVDGIGLLGGARVQSRAAASTGWAANSNRLAFLCVWGTSILWWLRFKGPRAWWQPLVVVPLIGLPIGTLMTGSRNGLLQLMLFGGLTFLEQRQWSFAQRAGAVVSMVLVGAAVLVAVPAALVERAYSFEIGPTTIDRINTLWAGLSMIASNPLLGVGPGNFSWRNQLLTGSTIGTHNSYLWALVSGGPMLLLLYGLLFYRTYRTLKALERFRPRGFEWLVTALRFNLIILFVYSFFAEMWVTLPVYLLLGLTIALARVAATSLRPSPRPPQPVPVPAT